MAGWLALNLRIFSVIASAFTIGGGIGYLTNKKAKIETPIVENSINSEEAKKTSPRKEWKSNEVSANCRRLYYSEGFKWFDDTKCENRLKRLNSRNRGTRRQ